VEANCTIPANSLVDAKCSRRKTKQTKISSGRSSAAPSPRNIIGEEKTNLKYIVEVCEPQAISYQPKTNAAQASHLDRIGFALRSVTLVHARGMGESISHALREALSSMHSADRHLRSTLPRSIRNTTVAGSQSCRGAGRVRRPQRPGNQSRAEARSQWIPPGNSPSRITGHRRLCRNALAGHAEHLA